MTLDDVTLIIPTYNMADYIRPLWDSIEKSGVLLLNARILFVDDGSTDSTRRELDSIKTRSSECHRLVSILALEKNHGRFLARFNGALQAKTSNILFVDTRIVLPKSFGKDVVNVLSDHDFVVGFADIQRSKSIYSLYWDITHKFIFNRHFQIVDKPILLTSDNYDNYLKGTTILLAPRGLFLKHCSRFTERPPYNDDTFLLKEMVRDRSLMIHPQLRCEWEPRQQLLPFLARLFERGPSFAEYHLFRVRGTFFWIVASTAMMIIFWFILLLINPTSGLILATVVAALATLTIFPMTRSPAEGIKLAGLHFLVILSFGFGVLYGIYKNIRKPIIHSPSAR